MRTIEMAFEVEKERQEEVKRKLMKLYPDLEILQEKNKITVKGDLSNYKRRGNIIYILTRGKHGKAIQAS